MWLRNYHNYNVFTRYRMGVCSVAIPSHAHRIYLSRALKWGKKIYRNGSSLLISFSSPILIDSSCLSASGNCNVRNEIGLMQFLIGCDFPQHLLHSPVLPAAVWRDWNSCDGESPLSCGNWWLNILLEIAEELIQLFTSFIYIWIEPHSEQWLKRSICTASPFCCFWKSSGPIVVQLVAIKWLRQQE